MKCGTPLSMLNNVVSCLLGSFEPIDKIPWIYDTEFRRSYGRISVCRPESIHVFFHDFCKFDQEQLILELCCRTILLFLQSVMLRAGGYL
jgi:hypothetical protein